MPSPPPPHPSFATTLSEGALHTALQHLVHHDILDAHLTPRPASSHLLSSHHALFSARLSLYRLLAPLLLLPSASSHSRALRPLRDLLAHLLAAVRLPPGLRAAITPQHIPPALREDASAAVAQAAALRGAALVDAWNGVATDKFAVEEVGGVASAVRAVKEDTRVREAETRRLDVAIADARRVAVDLYVRAVGEAVASVECDVEERDREGSADAARVDWLVARGRATTAKLRLQRAEIAALVYTEETVRALKKVRREVEERLGKVEATIEEGERKLREYRAGGERMSKVVEEYIRAKGRLEEVVWSRDELKR